MTQVVHAAATLVQGVTAEAKLSGEVTEQATAGGGGGNTHAAKADADTDAADWMALAYDARQAPISAGSLTTAPASRRSGHGSVRRQAARRGQPALRAPQRTCGGHGRRDRHQAGGAQVLSDGAGRCRAGEVESAAGAAGRGGGSAWRQQRRQQRERREQRAAPARSAASHVGGPAGLVVICDQTRAAPKRHVVRTAAQKSEAANLRAFQAASSHACARVARARARPSRPALAPHALAALRCRRATGAEALRRLQRAALLLRRRQHLQLSHQRRRMARRCLR